MHVRYFIVLSLSFVRKGRRWLPVCNACTVYTSFKTSSSGKTGDASMARAERRKAALGRKRMID